MRELKRKKISVYNLILLVAMLFILFGCGNDKNEETDDESAKNYVLKVGEEEVMMEKVMIYVYQVKNEFEQIGGEDVWEFEDFSGGKSADEVARDAVLDNIVRAQILVRKSEELNISLTDVELMDVKSEALDYFLKMNKNFISKNDIKQDMIVDVFVDNSLSRKVLEHITDEYNPKEPDVMSIVMENRDYRRVLDVDKIDLLTELKVYHILISTVETDEFGNEVVLSDEEKEKRYEEALKVREQALEGTDFTVLVETFSDEEATVNDNETGLFEFSKAFIPPEFRTTLEGLDEGEVSQVAETDIGYHLFKVVQINEPTKDDIDMFETNFIAYEEELRESAVKRLKEEAFNSLYEEWKKTVDVSVDREKWEQISFNIKE